VNLLPNPYILAIGIGIVVYMGLYTLKKLLSLKFGSQATFQNKWDTIVAHTIDHTTHLFMIASAIYVAFQYFPHTAEFGYYMDRGCFFIIMLQVGIWLNYLIDQWIISTINKKTRQNKAAYSGLSFLKLASKFLLFTVIFLFTLNNLNIKITTILAGLGVGGIAVALALQKILGDLLSSLSILLDKPFVVGDFIIVDTLLGEVEKIGLRSTQVRSLSGEQIIFPNSDLVGARIKNYKRMFERRVTFILSLALQTSAKELEEAVILARNIIKGKNKVRVDRVHFFQITKTSMDLEIVYFVLDADYNIHMDIQQIILLDIYRAYEDHGINFAYPYQVFHQGPPQLWKENENLFSIPEAKS